METPNLLKTWAFTLVQAFDYKKILCTFEDVHFCARGDIVNPGLITGAANSRIRTQTLDPFFLKEIVILFWARRVMRQTNSSESHKVYI